MKKSCTVSTRDTLKPISARRAFRVEQAKQKRSIALRRSINSTMLSRQAKPFTRTAPSATGPPSSWHQPRRSSSTSSAPFSLRPRLGRIQSAPTRKRCDRVRVVRLSALPAAEMAAILAHPDENVQTFGEGGWRVTRLRGPHQRCIPRWLFRESPTQADTRGTHAGHKQPFCSFFPHAPTQANLTPCSDSPRPLHLSRMGRMGIANET